MTHANPKRQPIDIRLLHERSQFEEAVQLQKAIWGFDDIELLPVRLFVVASKIGGHSFGAYDRDRMIGFCIAIPGIKSGGMNYLHSHMLGVLTDYNDLGIGRLLKLHQREEALARGIRLIEWTFDPLELKNAYFNMERLGAIVRRYVENQYGMTSSPLHGGLPTDRLVAEWWLGSERAARVLDGAGYKRPEIVDRIEVPSDIASIRRKNAKAAREVQRSIGDRFQRHFQQGFAVIGFERTPDSGVYLIGRPEEKE